MLFMDCIRKILGLKAGSVPPEISGSALPLFSLKEIAYIKPGRSVDTSMAIPVSKERRFATGRRPLPFNTQL